MTNQMFVIMYVSTNYPLSLTYVWPFVVCVNLTVIVDKRGTIQSTVVTKTCSSLISCSTIHELYDLHASECDAMTCNVVKRLASQTLANCLFDVIGQLRMLSFYRTEKSLSGAQRTVRNEEDNTLFSLGRSANSFVVSLLSDMLAQPEGTDNASY